MNGYKIILIGFIVIFNVKVFANNGYSVIQNLTNSNSIEVICEPSFQDLPTVNPGGTATCSSNNSNQDANVIIHNTSSTNLYLGCYPSLDSKTILAGEYASCPLGSYLSQVSLVQTYNAPSKINNLVFNYNFEEQNSGVTANTSLTYDNQNNYLYLPFCTYNSTTDGILGRYETDSSAFNILYNFVAQNNQPECNNNVILINNNIVGTTQYGGLNNNGSVYRMDNNGNLMNLYEFKGYINNDGSTPIGNIVKGSDNSIYGITAFGGVNGNYGTIYRVDGYANYQILYSFTYNNNTNVPYAQLIMTNNNSLFGIISNGGTNNNGFIFSINQNGSMQIIHQFQGGADGSIPTSISYDSKNNLIIGTTKFGGANNSGVIFTIDVTDSTTCPVVGPGFDGANCVVVYNAAQYNVSGPFNYYGKLYLSLSSGTNCPPGFSWDGANCASSINIDDRGVFSEGGNIYVTVNPTIYNKVIDLPTNTYTTGALAVENNDPDGYTGYYYMGVSATGGINNQGFIYAVYPESPMTLFNYGFEDLYDFSGDSLNNGIMPTSNLVSDNNHIYYGVTVFGGLTNNGTVFSFKR
jgi:uncharacterized repeat protein (TIGR03803 family)